MPTAVIYARISKDDEGDRLGVDRQERLCRELAKQYGLDVVELLVDNDVSAYARKPRPAFEQLVTMLKAGSVDTVLAYHADRLYRRTTDLERLVAIVEGSAAQVHTVAAGNVDLTTASGRMVARMLGAAAQHESERLGERIKVKNDELAAAGKPPGGRPPFGYGKGYEIQPVEAEAVRYMAKRVLEGGSLLRIARELDAMGVTTREGRSWHHSSVRAALINPAVAGLRVHRREVAGPGQWEPVLDRAIWEQVRTVLADPERKRKRPARTYLLAGLVQTCDGDAMNGRPVDDRRTYSTRMPTVGRSMVVGADDLENTVVETVLATLDKTTFPAAPPPTDAGADVAGIEEELNQLAALRGAGEISLAEWIAARKPLTERLEAARAKAGVKRRPAKVSTLLEEPGAARRAWPTLDFDTKREAIQSLIERVIVAPATRGRWTDIAERLLPENGGGIIWHQ